MCAQQKTALRGRPKTLDRDHLIEIAKESFWVEGVTNVSVNEICKRAGVSKPGLYREFGNEDGLKLTVLQNYREHNLVPLYEAIQADRPFADNVTALSELLLSHQAETNPPRGCLLQDMTTVRAQMGEAAADAIEEYRAESLREYENWVARARKNGEISTSLTDTQAAAYIDLQLASAMVLIKRESPVLAIDMFLRTAFSVFQ
ncbi:TetR/AcrR family transcriptional regulator [Aestuariibius sp. HNIBRBA575]|uniref:TetR/AcrR family transcriptional regulator n=1 Tax=Aestuariibius sp. HNIBRBA575 TaxID=3233343 RepID=UPI0034A28328